VLENIPDGQTIHLFAGRERLHPRRARPRGARGKNPVDIGSVKLHAGKVEDRMPEDPGLSWRRDRQP